jgi:hypothetical protein
VSLRVTALSYRKPALPGHPVTAVICKDTIKRNTPALVLDGFTNNSSQCISMMKQPFALGANPYMKPMFHDRLR